MIRLADHIISNRLTDAVESKTWAYIKKIDDLGGAIEAIKKGYFRDEISRSAYEYQKNVERGETVVVGLNRFQSDTAQIPAILKIDENMIRQQKKRLAALRHSRDQEAVRESLEKLGQAAESTKNLIPYIINCVEKDATLGEISDVLRKVFGVYRETY